MQMGWRWDFTFEILPQMAIATLNTILAAGVGYAIVYGAGAQSGNAAIVQITTTVANLSAVDLGTANFSIELLGVVQGVVADSLVSGNFA